jgi:hypothetical protein
VRSRLFWCAAAAALSLALFAAAQDSGGAAKKAKPPVPRTAGGKPDLSGIWQGGGTTGLTFAIGEANAKAARPDATPQPAARREPVPYQDWILPKLQEIRDRRGIDDPSGRCLLVGVPRITSMPLPLKIVQTDGEVIILYETFHAFRIIPTDGRGHPDDLDPSYMGDSVGHWDGDTLVVDVVGFNDKTWIGAGGATLHSDALHVVERYRRVDYDTITYDVTIEDPKVFTRPFSLPSSYLSLRPGERIREYECIADNQDLKRFEELLKNPSLFVRPPQ